MLFFALSTVVHYPLLKILFFSKDVELTIDAKRYFLLLNFVSDIIWLQIGLTMYNHRRCTDPRSLTLSKCLYCLIIPTLVLFITPMKALMTEDLSGIMTDSPRYFGFAYYVLRDLTFYAFGIYSLFMIVTLMIYLTESRRQKVVAKSILLTQTALALVAYCSVPLTYATAWTCIAAVTTLHYIENLISLLQDNQEPKKWRRSAFILFTPFILFGFIKGQHIYQKLDASLENRSLFLPFLWLVQWLVVMIITMLTVISVLLSKGIFSSLWRYFKRSSCYKKIRGWIIPPPLRVFTIPRRRTGSIELQVLEETQSNQNKRLLDRASFELQYAPCPICFDDLVSGQTALEVVKCKHIFHNECLLTWLKQTPSCPMCRAEIARIYLDEEHANIG